MEIAFQQSPGRGLEVVDEPTILILAKCDSNDIRRLTIGLYSDYLNRQLYFDQLAQERKTQLRRISEVRCRPVLVYASDSAKDCPNNIDYSDITPFADQLSVICGEAVDLLLETPGGYAEVVEDLIALQKP
jgi:hypothetical protein